MIKLTTSKATILVLGLPEGACAVGVNIPGNCFGYSLNGLPKLIDLPPGDWELLGNTWELTEEHLKQVMSDCIIVGHKQCFVELLFANKIYKVNPFGDGSSILNTVEFENVTDWLSRSKQWQEAEARTMPNSVVLIKRQADHAP